MTKPSRIVIKTIRLGFVVIYLNQSSERNMIDIPGCSERTNFKFYIFVVSCLKVICWALIIYVALSLHSTQGRPEKVDFFRQNRDLFKF